MPDLITSPNIDTFLQSATFADAKTALGLSTLATTGSADNLSSGTTNKVYTATEQTKLAGIASGADVTSATNIASITHGAGTKATPVDNDEFGFIDSAASNILKKLSWANIKAALKAYFDPIYLPTRSFGTAAALDVGVTGYKVVQLDSLGKLPAIDGSLLTGIGTPNSTLVRGTNFVVGNTYADTPATSPASLVISVGPNPDGSEYATINGTDTAAQGATNQLDAFNALMSLINGLGISGITASDGGTYQIVIANSNTGTGATITIAVSNANLSIVGSSSSTGTDDLPAGGGTSEVTLISAVAGKKIKIVNVLLTVNGGVGFPTTPVYLSSLYSGTYTDIGVLSAPGIFMPYIAYGGIYLNGYNTGESLVIRYTGDPGLNTGATGIAIVEQY